MVAQPGDSGTGTSPWVWAAIGIVVLGLGLMPFGMLLAGYMRKKPKPDAESENRCFDIKQLLDQKLRELTDVQAMAKEYATEMAKSKVREAVSGTMTGDVLVRAQKLEEQYNKLKKLYEECQIDVDGYTYKGVLIENSLLDKKILEHVKVIRTRTQGEWVLHDIRLSKKQIEDIQRNIADNKWYFHLWEPGKDIVTVVFKDKIFTITHSDKSTWKDAILYGVSQGIPEAQLDFKMV